MTDRNEASSAAPEPGRARAALSLRALPLWLVLVAGLAASFLLDGPVVQALRPLHNSVLAQVVQRLLRPVGTGHVQALALILLLAVGAWRGRAVVKSSGAWGLLALLISGVTANLLKVLIHRPRPWAAIPKLASWWDRTLLAIRDSQLRSFPSAESATTFAVVTVIAYFIPRTRTALWVVAVLVAAGRVIVGAHYPSDVWAGAMLGALLGRLVNRVGGSSGAAGQERLGVPPVATSERGTE